MNLSPPDLRILHFNDVYHIEPGFAIFVLWLIDSSRDPVGGAARFVSVQNEYRDEDRFAGQVDLVTFFSGDAFNPSIESSVTKVSADMSGKLIVGPTYGSYFT